MKRNSASSISLLIVICGVFLSQCKKADPVSSSVVQPVRQDPVRTEPLNNGFCNTWVCLSLPDDISKKWLGQPSDQGLSDGASVSVGPIVYFGGGTEEGDYNGGLDQVFGFNMDTEKREWLQTLLLPRSHLAAAAAGQKVIFAGGKNENVYNRRNPDFYDVVDIFDQQSGNRTTAKLSQPRAHLAAATVGSRAYFIGGLISVDKSTSRIDVYDADHGNWFSLDAPRPRAFAGAVADEGKLYIAGGMNPADAGRPILTIDVLDTKTGIWTSLEAPHAHPHASVVLSDNKIFIAGGDGLNNRNVDIYNIATKIWSSIELSDSRFDMAVAVMNDRIIFMGGNYSNAIDIYQRDSDSWTKGVLNVGVNGAMAGAWNNRSVFTGFKFDQGNALANVMWILQY